MYYSSWNVSDLLFKLHLRDERIQALESGEEYIRIKEHYEKELRKVERTNKRLLQQLADAKKQIKLNRKNWEQIFDDIIAEYNKKEAGLLYQVEKERKEKEEYKAKMQEALQNMYAAQTELADIKEKLAAAEAKLNKDFTNSSKPSFQTPEHTTIANGRKKSGKKHGGQTGHPHHGRRKAKNPRIVILPPPKEVLENPNRYERIEEKDVHKQVVSARLVVNAVELVAESYRDRVTGKVIHAAFPTGVVDDVTYDASVKAMVFTLNHDCQVSVGKTKRYLFDISDGQINLSTGWISQLSEEFSSKTEEERAEIMKQLLSSDLIHADFTFGRKQGHMSTVLIMTNKNATVYQSVPAKGNAGIENSPLPDYHGTVVHDHEAAFVNLNCNHQECHSHIKRYTIGSIQNEPDREWNRMLEDWIARATKHSHSFTAETEDSWRITSNALIQELREIMEKAKQEYEDVPPSAYYKDGYNLYRRIADNIDDYVLFLRNPNVPLTNNAAEQKGRVYKRKAHQAMCFRGEHGEENCCNALTVFETLRDQGENVYKGVVERFDYMIGTQRRGRRMTLIDRMRLSLTNLEALSVGASGI